MAGNLTAMIASIFSGGVTADPYYEYTTLLLPGNGTNGAQNNTFLDGSTNNFTITRNGNTTQGTFSPFSQTGWCSYSPGGSGNYWSVGGGMPSSQGTAFTLECWIYLTDLSTFRTITRGDNSGQLDLTINSAGTISLDNTSVVAICQGPTGAIQANRWHHIMVTRTTGNVYRVYVDGTGGTASSAYNTSMTANPRIGYNGFSQTYNFVGYISNFRVTNTLVQSNNFTPPTSPLTAISGTQLLTFQSNRFVDNSGNSNSITPAGSVTINAFSPFNPTASWSAATYGGSGYFDGNGDYLSIADNAAFTLGTSDFTAEIFVYRTATGRQEFFGQSDSGGSSTSINFDMQITAADKLQCLVFSGSTAYALTASAASIPLNAWTHIALVRDGNTCRQYINGNQDGTVSVTGVTINNSSSPMGIGRLGDVNANYFTGYLSNARLVVGTCVYPNGTAFTPPTAPLTAITNTSLLLNFTNAGIYDATSKNDLETVGDAQVSTAINNAFGASTGVMKFDGTGDYLQSVAKDLFAFGTGDYTVETWVYFTSINSTTLQIIFMSGSTGGNNFYAHVDSNQISVGTTAAFVSNQVSSFSTGVWYHIAFCRASGTLRLFKDGVQQGSSVTDSTNWISAGNARCGANESGTQTLFGYLQDLRITKYARYTANFTPPTAAFPTL